MVAGARAGYPDVDPGTAAETGCVQPTTAEIFARTGIIFPAERRVEAAELRVHVQVYICSGGLGALSGLSWLRASSPPVFRDYTRPAYIYA